MSNGSVSSSELDMLPPAVLRAARRAAESRVGLSHARCSAPRAGTRDPGGLRLARTRQSPGSLSVKVGHALHRLDIADLIQRDLMGHPVL